MGGRLSRAQAERQERRELERAMVLSQQAAPLPPGWMQSEDEHGTYFVNHLDRKTSRLDPRLPARHQRTRILSGTLSKPPPYVLDLPAKVAVVRTKLAQEQSVDFAINVRRDHLVEDSRRALEETDGWNLRQRLRVEFANEAGKDYGGMSREWFLVLSSELRKPEYGLFGTGDGYRLVLQPGGDEGLLHFVGLLCGLAAYHGMVVELSLYAVAYRWLLGDACCFDTTDSGGGGAEALDELRRVDEGFAGGLQWLLDNSVEGLELTFATQDGQPLMEGGETLAVTDANKGDYVWRIARHRLVDSVRPQLDALVAGFRQLVPLSVLEGLLWHELELMLCGSRAIDVDEWRAHTVYAGVLSEHSEIVRVFWELVRAMSQDERALLLRFVTGTDRLPVGGFAALHGSNGPCKFTVTSLDHRWDGLPTAHTCFNRLELPCYDDPHQLEQTLRVSMHESVGRFDME